MDQKLQKFFVGREVRPEQLQSIALKAAQVRPTATSLSPNVIAPPYYA